MTAAEVATAFVSSINEHDLQGLASLMTDDHVFVDALDVRVGGRDAMLEALRGYFAMVPDYWIKVEKLFEREQVVALFGRAGGTYAPELTLDPKNRWEIPAAWLAEVRGDKIAVWRVFADNFPLRRQMGNAHS